MRIREGLELICCFPIMWVITRCLQISTDKPTNTVTIPSLLGLLPIGLALLILRCSQPDGFVDKPAPDFVLNDCSSKRFYLSAQKGKIVFLNFWSIHCVPCMQEMPQLQKLWGRFKEQEVVIVGICTDPKEADYIDRFVKGIGLTYPILLDPSNSVARRYGARALPTSVLIDHAGIIRRRVVGYVKGDERKYAAALDRLIRKRKASER